MVSSIRLQISTVLKKYCQNKVVQITDWLGGQCSFRAKAGYRIGNRGFNRFKAYRTPRNKQCGKCAECKNSPSDFNVIGKSLQPLMNYIPGNRDCNNNRDEDYARKVC
jgi:hypothetical protein